MSDHPARPPAPPAHPPAEAAPPADAPPQSGTPTVNLRGAVVVPPNLRPEAVADFPADFSDFARIADGAMGDVYRATQQRPKRRVAIKTMKPGIAKITTDRARFLREAETAAQLNHPNIVPIYGSGETPNGTLYIVMPLLTRGGTLDAVLLKRFDRARPETWPQVADILKVAEDIAEGLTAAHELDLVHRDIKPSNIWLEMKTDSEAGTDASTRIKRCSILDFGLARPVKHVLEEISLLGCPVGTPAYMAPEQARGGIDRRADLFSLGVTLCCMATGRAAVEVRMELATNAPLSSLVCVPNLPPALTKLIGEMVSEKPGDRPTSAAEVVARVQVIREQFKLDSRTHHPLSGSLPVVIDTSVPSLDAVIRQVSMAPARPEPPVPLSLPDASSEFLPVAEPLHAGRRLWAVAAVCLVAIVGLLAWQFAPWEKSDEQTPPQTPGAELKKEEPPKKEPPKIEPPKKEPAVDFGADRRAAEFVLSVGGTCFVEHQDKEVSFARDLPGGPFRLTGAVLSGPLVTDRGLSVFEGCTNLTRLGLAFTGVTDGGLVHFRNCKNLARLDLASTGVGDAGLKHFADRKSLKHLDLSGTNVTDAGLGHFRDCPFLTHLDLAVTGIGDAGLGHFADCKNLTHLRLSGTNVTNDGLAHFRECKGLTNLILARTRIDDVGLAHFRNCPKLRSVNVYGTRATDEVLNWLRECRVEALDLQDTRVTPNGIAATRAARPRCRIYWDGGTVEP